MKLASYNLFFWLPDKLYIRLLWWFKLDYGLNLKSPETYNEKLQWLKLNYRNPLLTSLADKYEVRSYIREKIGDQYLIPLLGVYDSAEQINWDELPDQFVLKCNHDSGSVIICTDKSSLDKNTVIKKLSRRLGTNATYNLLRVWPYKNIKRKILCEKYLANRPGELTDYKFFCFDGEPKAMFIATERNSGDVKFDYYDINFNNLNIVQAHKQSEKKLSRPKGFDEMVRLSGILSQNIPHVRVDFYDIKGKVYFGEMTFFHHSGLVGFTPGSIDELWGSWIKLPGI